MIAVRNVIEIAGISFDFYCHHLLAFAFKARWLLNCSQGLAREECLMPGEDHVRERDEANRAFVGSRLCMSFVGSHLQSVRDTVGLKLLC